MCWGAQQGCDTASQAHDTTYNMAGLRVGRAARGESDARTRGERRARAAWQLGMSRDKNFISWLGATFWVAIQRETRQLVRCDTALCVHDTTSNAGGMGLGVTIQFYIAAGGRLYGRRRPMTRHPGATIRRPGATILRSTRHDTAPSARPGRSVRSAWALGVHPVHPTQF